MATITLNLRVLRPLSIFLFCILCTFLYIYHAYRPPTGLYTALFRSELELSRDLIHNERGNKYVKFKQLRGAGFNNQAQEILLYHHLALQTSRIYVYQPFIWRPRGEKAEVPLSAFLHGPTQGMISDAVFDEVCPPEEVIHVQLQVNHLEQWHHAVEVLNRKARCVVVDDWILNWNFLASPGTHAIWPTFQKYLSNHFKWSDNVLNVVNRTQTELHLRSSSLPYTEQGETYMAIHLRRGDFEEHCKYLGETQQGFTTWATLPILRPAILPPKLDTHNTTTVMDHCYPSLYRILESISEQARDRPHLRTLHVLHDGAWDHPTVYLQYYKLAWALKNPEWARRAGWKGGPMLKVTHSAEVPIQWGERDWSVCVDVELGRRAEVFIGNGYSSLTTQIIALRLSDKGGKVEDITLY